ncbi:transcriptional regulator [Pasteurellaceae bacterium RH1A]|nr:transcriptional regulator [Pasteurellaceae bacterium RH1A]
MQLHQLDLNLLKALDALLDEQNVSRAAERLSVTQSAMSGMLARLRESLNEPLFVRAQYGMLPTERALGLQAPVKQILSQIESLLQPPEFIPAQAEFTVKIGATDYAFRAVIVPFLQQLNQLAPKIKVALLPIQSGNVANRLHKGELDLALITQGETAPDFRVKPLYDEHYVCAMRADHPLLANWSLESFCQARHALISYQGGQFAGVVDEMLAGLGKSRQVDLSVSSFLILPEILKTTDLIATVPSRLVQGEGLALRRPPLEVKGFTKLLAWHERTHHSQGHKWVRDLLVRSCQSPF